MVKKFLLFLIFLIFITSGLFYLKKYITTNATIEKSQTKSTIKSSMKISSNAFENNQEIPGKYTCDGKNINPPLTISDIPATAKSLVLIVDDPDAPVGTWVHWVVFNIPPTTKEITENAVPKNSSQGITSFGKPGYGGPCPPSGTHRYMFKLYALNGILNLDQHADKKAVEAAMQPYIIDQSQLTGLYSKK